MRLRPTYRPALRLNPWGPAVIRSSNGVSCRIQYATLPWKEIVDGTLIGAPEACRVVRATALPARHSINGVRNAPAAGNRNRASGALNNVGSNGNFWSFAPNSQTNARNLNFNSGNVNPLNNNNRANGFALWAARAFGWRWEVCFILQP